MPVMCEWMRRGILKVNVVVMAEPYADACFENFMPRMIIDSLLSTPGIPIVPILIYLWPNHRSVTIEGRVGLGHISRFLGPDIELIIRIVVWIIFRGRIVTNICVGGVTTALGFHHMWPIAHRSFWIKVKTRRTLEIISGQKWRSVTSVKLAAIVRISEETFSNTLKPFLR